MLDSGDSWAFTVNVKTEKPLRYTLKEVNFMVCELYLKKVVIFDQVSFHI